MTNRTPAIILSLAALALAACGESEQPTETQAPAAKSIGALSACGTLIGEDFSDAAEAITTITEALDVDATEELPAHCYVLAQIAPETGVEIRLPAQWNGRLLFTGCGGLCGVIGDPRACAFDPASLQCEGAATDACLTAEQVSAAQKIYDGARDPDGSPYYAMGYAKGTELDWVSGFLGDGDSPPRRAGSTRFILNQKIGPQATLADFDYSIQGATGSPVGGLLDFGPDGRKLGDFTRQGGKIHVYHGWSDTDAIPASSLFFQDAQVAAFGADAVPEFLRLFFLPGMRHCRGGPGVDTADYLSVMEAWVERGEAPESLAAFRTSASPASYTPFPLEGEVEAGRMLFPYPADSEYTGSGDPADPANWRRKN